MSDKRQDCNLLKQIAEAARKLEEGTGNQNLQRWAKEIKLQAQEWALETVDECN